MMNKYAAPLGLFAIAIVAVFSLVTADVFARGQGKGGPGGCPGAGPGMHGFGHLDRMQKELGLTDEQVKKIFDIGTQYRQKYFDNRGNRDKVKALHEEHRKAVEAVFTKEQKEKHDKLFSKGWKHGKGKGQGKGRCCDK